MSSLVYLLISVSFAASADTLPADGRQATTNPAMSGPEVSLTLIPPSPASEQVSVDIRAAIRNRGRSDRQYEARFYLDEETPARLLRQETVTVAAGAAKGLGFRWPAKGKAGRHKLILCAGSGSHRFRAEQPIEIIAAQTRSLRRLGGAWVDLYHHSEPEGIPFNDELGKMTAQQWRELVRAMHEVDQNILVITMMFQNYTHRGQHRIEQDGYQGKAYYPSRLFPGRMSIACDDPLEAILAEADRLGMQVMPGVGTYAFGDYGPGALAWCRNVADELWVRYGHHPSFYGWYVSAEKDGSLGTPEEQEEIIEFFRQFTPHVRRLAPDKPVMLAPNCFRIRRAREAYQRLLPHVDILCPFGFHRMPEGDLSGEEAAVMMQAWCDQTEAHLWMDLESFVFRNGEELHPRPIKGLISDFTRFDNFEKTLHYQFPGLMSSPAMSRQPGGPDSVALYIAYNDYLAASKRPASQPAASQPAQKPFPIHDDGSVGVRLSLYEVMNGVQPCLGDAGNGVLIVQAQVSLKPYGNRRRINHYPWRVANRISRDYGKHWEDLVIRPNTDPPFIEGGTLLRRDGSFLLLDTYITPIAAKPEGGEGQSPSTNSGHSRNSVMGTVPDEGEGDLWISRDGCRTIQDPVTMKFRIPGVDFDASKDDGGREHRAIRLHRSVLELPGKPQKGTGTGAAGEGQSPSTNSDSVMGTVPGDLLTTAYGCFKGDKTPCPYQPKMMKSRTILFRSRDGGKTWDYVSTIAVGNVGSEGFDEPVLCRLSRGEHAGRLICMMRTGADLHQAISDDEGVTWSAATPVVFPGIDLHDVERWKHYVDTSIPHVKRYPVATGAIVDPDLIELDNGILVCAVGARIPEKACFTNPRCPRNGNYLAFSRDQGKTWNLVLQLTSGVLTTHYMAIRQIRPNQLYVTYDLGFWGRPDNRIMGCTVEVAPAVRARPAN